jgi:glycosyltransferase involved in cell wall biosynthesis
MRVLISSAVDIDRPSAMRNRLVRMLKAIEGQGHAGVLVGSASSTSGAAQHSKLNGVDCVTYPISYRRKLMFRNAAYRSRLAEQFYRANLETLLAAYEIDIQLAFTVNAGLAHTLVRLSRQKGVPVVADVVEWFGISLRYLLNGVNWQLAQLTRAILPKVDGLIGISKAWCDWADQKGLPNVWIPSFAEDHGCVRTEASQADRPFTMVFIGHWVEREKPRQLLRAIRMCLDRGVDVRLRVLGNVGKTRWERRAMKLLRNDPKLTEHVEFLGFVSDEQRDQELAGADAFAILREDCRETDMLFPTRLPEYMLTANPVILSKVGSFPYCFEHGKDVWFVDPANRPTEIADAITHLAQNPEERLAIGQRGRQSALEQFSMEVLGERLATFLKTVLQTQRNQ